MKEDFSRWKGKSLHRKGMVMKMNYCPYCGAEITEEQKFCGNCGANLLNDLTAPTVSKVSTVSTVAYSNQQGSSARPGNIGPYPMAWYSFLIYVSLFLGAAGNLYNGLGYFTGFIYSVQSDWDYSAAEIYAAYGDGLKALDMLYGVFLLGLAVFGIYVRFRLAKFKKGAPELLYILFALAGASGLTYSTIITIMTGYLDTSDITVVLSFIFQCVLIICNYKYFTRRKELFCN